MTLEDIYKEYIPLTDDDYFGHDNLKRYFIEIDKYPILDEYKERILIKAAKNGDEEARNFLLSCHLKFVVKIAKKYQHQGVDLLDIIALGNQGLIKAYENYNLDMGVKFLSYAGKDIITQIERGLPKNKIGVYTKFHMMKDIVKYKKTIELIYQKFDSMQIRRNPTNKEIADTMGVSITKVQEIQKEIYIMSNSISFDATYKEDSDESIEAFIQDNNINVQEQAIMINTREEIKELIPAIREVINNDKQFIPLILHIVRNINITDIKNDDLAKGSVSKRVGLALYKLRTKREFVDKYIEYTDDYENNKRRIKTFRELYRNRNNRSYTFLNSKKVN